MILARRNTLAICYLCLSLGLVGLSTGLFRLEAVWAQEASSATSATGESLQPGEVVQTPEQVEVEPTAQDEEIARRLQGILESTQWFRDPTVRVENGVVFLEGRTQEVEHKKWASTMAQRTRDVVAVVNRITVVESSLWDLSPAWVELRSLWRQTCPRAARPDLARDTQRDPPGTSVSGASDAKSFAARRRRKSICYSSFSAGFVYRLTCVRFDPAGADYLRWDGGDWSGHWYCLSGYC